MATACGECMRTPTDDTLGILLRRDGKYLRFALSNTVVAATNE